MAGHSKFKKIKHKKATNDDQRSKMFSKLVKAITVAARLGGVDPASNPRLRTAMLAAKQVNLPKANIDSALKRAVVDTSSFHDMIYEGYGTGGVAFLVETLTDNKMRTMATIRNAFNKNGGRFADPGSVIFMFKNLGYITYPATVKPEEEMFEVAVDAGAEECQKVEDEYEIFTEFEQFHPVKDSLEKLLGEPSGAELIWKANSPVTLDKKKTDLMMQLMDRLEDCENVQNVWTNLEIPPGYGENEP